MAADGYRSRRRGGEEDRGGRHSQQNASASAAKASGGSSRDRGSGDARQYQRQSGSQQPMEKPMPLADALKGLEEATGCSDRALRCVASVLDTPSVARTDAEIALQKMSAWLWPSSDRQVLSQVINSHVPAAVVRAVRKFCSEPLCAALCCVVIVRSTGSLDAAIVHLKAGALEEVGALMDRHPHHGGVQNVCLLALGSLMKDAMSARQAVTSGALARVLRAMEATAGREVQFNGLQVLRLLIAEGRAPQVGLQEVAMRAKVAHQSDSTVCALADEVLALVTPRFKEMLCWHWQSGWCKLGPRCTFAHGPGDLRAT